MAYCTRQDLVDRIGEDLLRGWSDLEATGVANEGRLTRAIEDAGAEIDSYAQTRFAVPFVPTPSKIRQVAVDLAIWNLASAKGIDENSADRVHVQRWKAAVAYLRDLADGRAALGAAQPEKDPGSVLVAPDRVFDRDTMEGF
ncbi:MAG: DUF1320 domain-containing protein [Deltaproteobacteria bacterium]|nr:DUF1320 domain-containing protein [Deltaproteobacteria bacterium]